MPPTDCLLRSRYRLLREVGSGGMGVVYQALDTQSGVEVAVKEMTCEGGISQQESWQRQFRFEAEVLLRLEHPNLPRVQEFFEENGRFYLVMEYIRGHNLGERIELQGPATEASVLGWLRQLCQVLGYLHSRRPPIVFRDLKPSNIMLTHDGGIKLIDFGIAKESDPVQGSHTQTGLRGILSPGFAAPEQYTGGTDASSDLYALGATTYFLLTGELPPDSLARASGQTDLPSLARLHPELSPSLVQAVEWMLQLNRNQRPASVQEVALKLGLLSPSELPTSRVPLTARTRPAAWHRAALVLLAVGLTAGLAGALSAHLDVDSSPPGAIVTLNGRQVGQTPLHLRVPPWLECGVRAELTGYSPITEYSRPRVGSTVHMDLELQPLLAGSGPDGGPVAPDFYPPSKGPPPDSLARQEHLLDLAYSIPPGWTVEERSEQGDRATLVLTTGDGRSQSRQRVVLEVELHPTDALEDKQARLRAARQREGWQLVTALREGSVARLRMQRRRAGLTERGFLALRQDQQRYTVWVESSPCPDSSAMVGLVDRFRGHLGFDF